jgi:hypothetical protein
MVRLRTLFVLSTSLVGLLLASPAVAHELEISRANKANKAFAKSLCAPADEKCISSAPGPCKRVSEHRVRCEVSMTVEAADKSQGRCLSLVEWYLRGKSSLLFVKFLGIRSCQQVKPPPPAPAPAP